MPFRAARAAIAIPAVALCALAGASLAGASLAASAEPAASASHASAPPQLTGTELAAALLPAKAFPPGYAISMEVNSGRHLETGQVKYHLGVLTCARFAAAYGGPGFGETAVASNSYGTLYGGFGSGSGQSFRQMVYQFGTAHAAQSFFQGLQKFAGKCPTWRLQPPGNGWYSSAGTLLMTTSDGQAFQLSTSVSGGPGGSAQDQALIVVDGADLVEIDAVAFNRSLPDNPPLDALAHKLITSVHAAK